jgi:hypothetical protein
MLSKLAYAVVGLAIVALSFSATLFALNQWTGGAAADEPLYTASIPTPDAIRDTTVADLPKLSAFDWYTVRGLNVKAANENAVLAGQPILRLLSTPNDTGHSLVAQYHGLNKNQVYRITAWVRPEAGGNVEVSALDHPSGAPVNRCIVVVDLSSRAVVSADGTKTQGVESGPGNWQKVWFDLPTSDGQFLVAVRPAKGNADSYRGDGRLGVTLGGIQMDPRHG